MYQAVEENGPTTTFGTLMSAMAFAQGNSKNNKRLFGVFDENNQEPIAGFLDGKATTIQPIFEEKCHNNY